MTTHLPSGDFDIAIIGGGAGGVLTALHALRLAEAGVRIALIEPTARLAQGVAYATTHAEHLLNVPARRMSAFNDKPDDFVDFLVAREGESARDAIAVSSAQRRHYGDYRRERLQQARDATAARFEVVQDRVTGLDDAEGMLRIDLESGQSIRARGIVVAVGNNPKPLPARGTSDLSKDSVLEAWNFDAIKRIPADAEICIAGSGLSMVDTALSLVANGHRGRVHVLSRHALLPLSHSKHAVADFDAEALLAMRLRQRMRVLRDAAREAQQHGLPWQAVMESARPLVQKLWCTLCDGDQRRFLRHVVRYWDVHRHRIAPQVHAQLERLQASGQLRLHRGRLQTVSREGNRIRVTLMMRDRRTQELDVDRIVNATGVEMRAQLMRNPLLSDLLGKGKARPGPHGIGIDTAVDGEMVDAQGQAQPDLMVVGSLRIGRLWESIAVPELRGQAEAAARRLLALARAPAGAT
ncbi:MAG: FAD/NAD(P)-binding protein [Pseudoxanthomonas sp.]